MAVGRLKGINKLTGDTEARTVDVEFDPSALTVEQLLEALENVGYEATVAP